MTEDARLAGVLPVFQTPFAEDGDPDLDALASELGWMAGQGVDGVVFGMVSEVLRLAGSEWSDVVATACAAAAEHALPAVISVGAESTHRAVRLAAAAEEAGAAALMAIPPITVALPDEELERYYESILQASSIPLVVQDASGYVGRSLSIELQARLLDAHGDRVLFKPEAVPIGPRLTALAEATSGRARAFEGSGGIALIESYRRGIVGTMPGADLCWALVTMWRCLEAGDDASAYEIAGPLLGLVVLQPTLDAFVAIEKYLLRKQGVLPRDDARGPVSFRLDAETRAEVDRLFERLEQAVAAVRERAGVGA